MKTDDLPQKSFERNMNHNYMILSKCDFFDKEQEKQDYRVRMLLGNKINGLLPVSHRMINGAGKYYYEINSLQSMDRVYAKDELDHRQLCILLMGCIRLYDSLEEYLLDGSQVILKPEYIYLNMDSLEPYFVYFPEYEEDARDSFAQFMEIVLSKVDHTDEQAVILAYQVYRYTRNQNYVLNEIVQMIEQTSKTEKIKIEKIKTEKIKTEPEQDITDETTDDDWDSISYTPYQQDSHKEIEEEAVTDTAPAADKKDLKWAAACLILAVCATGLLSGQKVTGAYRLSEKQILYLYGAISMSIMAGVIFMACYFRKKNRARQIAELEQEEEYPVPDRIKPKQSKEEYIPQQQPPYAYGDTICLQQLTPQEPYLTGRVNGEDITIRLDRLPMTIGKMAGRADYIIADNTVSKIHARIEEKNGAIYVEDLNSTNGTLRNGMMIGMNEPVLLQAGDELTIGRINLRFCA